MKKIILLAAGAALLLSSTGCQKQLDIPQKGVIATEDYYKTDEDCRLAVAAMYNIFYNSSYRLFRYTLDITTTQDDDSYFSASALSASSGLKMCFSIGTDNSSIKNAYIGWFTLVYRANIIIDKFKDGTTDAQKRAVAEAKVLRALAYSKLICIWGTPPKVDHVLSGSAEYNQPNGDTADLWDWTIRSLKEAAESGALPSKTSVSDKTTQTRVTKEFAWALKGKCEVYAGRYEDAKTSLKKVMDSNLYDLYPQADLETLLKKPGNFNCEKIFENNFQDPGSGYGSGNCLSDQFNNVCAPSATKWGVEKGSFLEKNMGSGANYYVPTEDFINKFKAKEGESPRFKAWIWSYEDMIANGLKPFEAKEQTFDPIPLATVNYCAQQCCGYWNWKLVMLVTRDWMTSSNYKLAASNYCWLRYADVLLLYAEACVKTGKDLDKGLAALNKVQTRAGAPLTALSLETVKAERRFELFGEGERWIDLVRWGDAPTVLKDHYTKLPVFYGYKKGTTEYNIVYYNTDETWGERKFVVGKNEHLPFPAAEVSANTLLKQNPGW